MQLRCIWILQGYLCFLIINLDKRRDQFCPIIKIMINMSEWVSTTALMDTNIFNIQD